jgi:PTH1 family peptidyl-tRNA hydrolase
MRLIVGLGNPGRRYRDSPHNTGFRVCERLAERHRLGESSRRFQGRFWRGRIAGEDVGVLMPETYMNLSGEAVSEAVRYLPLGAGDVVVVYDEMDLPIGRLRIRPGGGSAGHNGMKSVIERLGTEEFPRVRVGVGRPPRGREPTGHLLGRAEARVRDLLERAVERAADGVETILSEGIEEAMNRFNGLPPLDSEEEEQE